jgi:hypothetical protein
MRFGGSQRHSPFLKSGGDADGEGDAFVLEIIEIGDITDERIVFESDAITAILVGGERIVLMLFDKPSIAGRVNSS